MQLAATVFGDTDVFGLDVTVCHALGFEVVHGPNQLFAKALQHVQREAAFFLEFLGQGLRARALEQQCGAAGNRERFTVGNDVLVVQAGQHLAFGDEAVVVRDVASHFQDGFIFIAIATN